MANLDEADRLSDRRELHSEGLVIRRVERESPLIQLAGFDKASTDELDVLARGALTAAKDAYHYLEDDDLADAAHDNVHRIGRLVGLVFGCPIKAEGGIYYNTCPVSLAHERWGFSIGMTSRRLCSHCHEDIDDCEHLLDQVYPLTVSKDEQGLCSLCATAECGHTAGQEVLTQPWATIGSMDLHEVSVVRRPRDPLTRPTKIEIDTAMLRQSLGDEADGRDLECTICIEPCRGFSHFTQ